MHNKIIYTIGHSTHELDDFLKLLVKNSISCIVDVRSIPFSARVPHFNKEDLRQHLEKNNIVYLHFPKAFGARQKDPKLLDESGRVDFEKVRQTVSFREGVDKLHYCLEQGHKVSLMCSEANPLDCHRFSMISYQLVKEGFLVNHILKHGSVINNSELEQRLLDKYSQKISDESLFGNGNISATSLIDLAYKLRNKDIGFIPNQVKSETKNVPRSIAKSEGLLPFSTEPDNGHLQVESSRPNNCESRRLYTIGFTNKSARDFFELLQMHNVRKIIDTRINNVSQLSGFAKGKDLEFFARAIGGIDYCHELNFAPTKELLESYRKKQISWDEYAAEYRKLLESRKVENQVTIEDLNQACLLCSEHLPEKCHRRLLAEYIKDKCPGLEIIHLK
ncbi:MAG TPA: DUF488 domain-containing protein [Pyrinomonadaceae bacterium]